MERGSSLLDIMNEVSARLDRVTAQPLAARHEPLGELQAFMLLDPLLAGLHKEYLDAKASRMQAQREFGASDGMTDMAVILEDSAWCAMQTRYMELRADPFLHKQANVLVADSYLEKEEQARKRKEEETWRYVQAVQTMVRMRDEDRRVAAGWWIIAMMYFSQAVPMFRNHHASHRFNLQAA